MFLGQQNFTRHEGERLIRRYWVNCSFKLFLYGLRKLSNVFSCINNLKALSGWLEKFIIMKLKNRQFFPEAMKSRPTPQTHSDVIDYDASL